MGCCGYRLSGQFFCSFANISPNTRAYPIRLPKSHKCIATAGGESLYCIWPRFNLFALYNFSKYSPSKVKSDQVHRLVAVDACVVGAMRKYTAHSLQRRRFLSCALRRQMVVSVVLQFWHTFLKSVAFRITCTEPSSRIRSGRGRLCSFWYKPQALHNRLLPSGQRRQLGVDMEPQFEHIFRGKFAVPM